MATAGDKEHGGCAYRNDESLSMKVIIKTIKMKWPNVRNITTSDLHAQLEQRKPIILLDTRPEEEYVVSRIAGARRVSPEAADVEKTYSEVISNFPVEEHTAIVCYCSVGYRSTKYAAALKDILEKKEIGASRVSVFNLEGSLFKWANEGRPMVDKNGKGTVVCHQYSSFWGKLLKSGLVYNPAKES